MMAITSNESVQAMNNLRPEHTEELIERLSHGLTVRCDEDFFPSITVHLAKLLQADYALVGAISANQKGQIDSLAFVVDGQMVENVSYLLPGSPCEQVLGEQACLFPRGVQQLFPEATPLIELNAEGYAGLPLKNAVGETVGIISVLFRQEIPNPKMTELMLRIFAGRAGSELERRRDQNVLKEREQNFRSFYEHSPLSYQSLNGEGRFIDVNPAWTETFGYTREEVLGRKFTDLMTDASEALVAKRFPILKERGELRDAAFEMIRKDGQSILVTLYGRASYDEQGHFLHTNCILTDVTQARKAEARLRRRDEENRLLSKQFQALLDSIPDRIILLDHDLRIIWTNQRDTPFEKDFSCDPTGRFCYEIMQDRNEACAGCPVVSCFESGQVEHRERVNADGRTWSQRAFPIVNDQGEVFNVVEIGQDITEKVKLQKETARTGQLAALGELAAGVAHEINNPITGVINYAQLLKNRSEQGSDGYDLAERIIKEGDRVARIVSQLLFISRDEGGARESVDIADVLSDTLTLVGSQFNNEGIIVNVTIAEKIPKIQAHAQQLVQLFLNVLSNARYALNKRYPEAAPGKLVEVSLSSRSLNDDDEVVICFRDQGTGIPADLLDKVLQPFMTNKPTTEGTGLGLSISNDIVNKHNGSLLIESEEGQYTEVTVSFPVQKSSI